MSLIQYISCALEAGARFSNRDTPQLGLQPAVLLFHGRQRLGFIRPSDSRYLGTSGPPVM